MNKLFKRRIVGAPGICGASYILNAEKRWYSFVCGRELFEPLKNEDCTITWCWLIYQFSSPWFIQYWSHKHILFGLFLSRVASDDTVAYLQVNQYAFFFIHPSVAQDRTRCGRSWVKNLLGNFLTHTLYTSHNSSSCKAPTRQCLNMGTRIGKNNLATSSMNSFRKQQVYSDCISFAKAHLRNRVLYLKDNRQFVRFLMVFGFKIRNSTHLNLTANRENLHAHRKPFLSQLSKNLSCINEKRSFQTDERVFSFTSRCSEFPTPEKGKQNADDMKNWRKFIFSNHEEIVIASCLGKN